jgi:thiamine biosynthesis protein ThiS
VRAKNRAGVLIIIEWRIGAMVTVNGNEVACESGTTIASLLEKMEYVMPHIIVRVNGELVYESAYRSLVLEDGDVVDAIHPMVGG